MKQTNLNNDRNLPVALTWKDLVTLPRPLTATQEYTPVSFNVKFATVSWLLVVRLSLLWDTDIRDWFTPLSSWSLLNHWITGEGSPVARQDATKFSPLTTSRTAEGKKVSVGGTEWQDMKTYSMHETNSNSIH